MHKREEDIEKKIEETLERDKNKKLQEKKNLKEKKKGTTQKGGGPGIPLSTLCRHPSSSIFFPPLLPSHQEQTEQALRCFSFQDQPNWQQQ